MRKFFLNFLNIVQSYCVTRVSLYMVYKSEVGELICSIKNIRYINFIK